MGTLRVYTKPDGFRLPIRYQRLTIGEVNNNTNYSFCRRIESDMPGFTKFQIGVYLHLQGEVTVPRETTVSIEPYTYPAFYDYNVYLPDNGDILFCVGAQIENLHEPLLAHSESTELYLVPFDLKALERAQQSGRARIKGQTCLTEGRSLRISQRKIDGHVFSPTDTSFRSGEGVEEQSLELTVQYNDKQKSVTVYTNGTITTKGRTESGTSDFGLLKRAYDQVIRFIGH
jgi:hypothetical protein